MVAPSGRRVLRLLGASAALVCAALTAQVEARGVHVNLTATWPSSPLYPLLEASEFLAEENPLYFWRFVDALETQQSVIAEKKMDADTLAAFAVDKAQEIAPHTKNMLELTISTRTYSAKVEMFRQLALDSSVRVCGPDAEAWAVVYKDKHCVTAVACSPSELSTALSSLHETTNKVCFAAGVNDVELSADHKFPHTMPPRDGSVILYGSLGSASLYEFHRELRVLAKDGAIAYMLRHYPKDSTLETLLQGYGVALDIKNMEYKTIDDSKKAGEAEDATGDEEEEEEEMRDDEDDDEEVGADEEIDGLVFSNLFKEFASIKSELKVFRDHLVKQHDQAEGEIKAWHLKDIGISAAREILDSRNPLKRLRILAQDFPKHAKKLAFSRKALSDELREEIDSRRNEAMMAGLLNRFLVNGIVVDPMQRSFNIFDFVSTLKKEWSIAKRIASLPLTAEEREHMLTSIRESKSEKGAVRIRVRGPIDGFAPLYLNNIETDHQTKQWPTQVANLRRPSWNLIFIRKNMYEYVVAFDPTSQQGRIALGQISFLRMRGAPLQWGFLISTKELMTAKTKDERDEIVKQYKQAEFETKATGWHFAKLLLMTKAKDTPDQDGMTGRIVQGFIEGVADEGGEVTVQTLIDCYLDTVGGSFSRGKSRSEALATMRSDKFDEEVMSMTEFIGHKHLPFESALFNGVLKTDLDLQNDIMNHFGRDQALFQEMARDGELNGEMDLVEELLSAQEAYPSYFSLFSEGASTEDENVASIPTANHLFSNDENAVLENLVSKLVKFAHQANTATQPKKQTLLFWADLNDPVHAGHVRRAYKAVQENLGKVMRVGVIHRLKSAKELGVGELVASIVDVIGDSDAESHVSLVTEALACVTKGKTVDATKSKLGGIIEKFTKWKSDKTLVYIKDKILVDGDVSISDELHVSLVQLNRALASTQSRSTSGVDTAQLYLNGYRIDLPEHPITEEDIAALIGYDMKHRSQPVAKAFIKRSAMYTAAEANERSMEIVKASAVVDEYRKAERHSGMNLTDSNIVIRLPGDESLRVVAYIDPLTEAAQRMSSLLVMLRAQLNATVELLPLPASDYSEFPLQRFYRYLFDKKTTRASSVTFRKLPIKPILTMKIDTPEAWNVQIHTTADDLDNLRVDPDSPADVRAIKTASFRLESLLVYGQCRDKTFDQYIPPNGLQLVLERDIGSQRLHRDTLVMKNFGYFQLQATPGVWNLHLARGRAVDLFEIVEPGTDKRLQSTDIIVSGFTSRLEQLLVQKRPGKEHDELLAKTDTDKTSSGSDVEPIAADAGILGSLKSMFSMFGKKKVVAKENESPANDKAVATVDGANTGRKGETIHVFSLASGHLYERFLKIMMLSVLKRTENPVTFWLLENFLSPDFKSSIPALRSKFGMDIRLVTYKWPNWLRQQTQKQRIIWGYKILFLDVLFPLGVQKIIYVDADQVVRADLKELWEMDLHGAPYGYTPFCDSRNVGFQFWRQGYWKDHLRGRPYHISALYVVDLALFRQMAAGDMLRAIYDQLSADPNSLSNLDQDLPNYAQHQIPIHSLPNEWLWCESWCSDESKERAKTIDLCNNPKHKEPKLDMAKRVISGELFNESWLELDQEVKDAEKVFAITV